MKIRRPFAASTIFLTALALTSAVWAQEKSASSAADTKAVLKIIPDNALGFVLVRNIGKTDGEISTLVDLVQPQLPSVLTLLKMKAGIQEGLDEHGSAALAVIPDSESADAKPIPLIIIPVTDYKKFIGQLQPDDPNAEITGIQFGGSPGMVAAHKGSFAIFGIAEKKDQLSKALAATASVDTVVESYLPWIAHHQISIVATPRGTKLALQAALVGLKKVRSFVAMAQTGQNPQQIELGFKIYETFLAKAAEEVEGLAIGARLDGHSNLFIDSRTTFIPGGAWANGFKGLKPSKEKRFVGLPAAPFMFAADGTLPKKWARGIASFSSSTLKMMNEANGDEKISPDEMKKYEAASASFMKGVSGGSLLMTPPKSGESIYDGVSGIMKVDDAKKYIDQYEKSLHTMIGFTSKQKNPMFKITDVKKIELDGVTGLSMTSDISGMIAAQSNGINGQIAPQLFGANGVITARVLAADDHTIVLAYGSEDHAKRALADLKSSAAGLASDPDVEATLDLLSPRAQWVGLVGIKGYMDFIRGIMPPSAGPITLPELPAMPPVGFAAEGTTNGLTTQLVVPAATIAKLSTTFHHVAQPREVPDK